jgi:hypothetical protein
MISIIQHIHTCHLEVLGQAEWTDRGLSSGDVSGDRELEDDLSGSDELEPNPLSQLYCQHLLQFSSLPARTQSIAQAVLFSLGTLTIRGLIAYRIACS